MGTGLVRYSNMVNVLAPLFTTRLAPYIYDSLMGCEIKRLNGLRRSEMGTEKE